MRQYPQPLGHVGQRVSLAGGHGARHGIRLVGIEESVQQEVDVLQPQRAEFPATAFRLGQRRALGPADQRHLGSGRVGQALQRPGVQRVLRLESRQRPQAGRSAGIGVQKLVPRRRQLEQTKRVPRGRCIEHDMIVVRGRFRLAQKAGELIERRNFRGAGAGQLFLDARHHRGRQGAAIGRDHALAVLAGRRLGIDVQGPKGGHRFKPQRRGRQFRAQHFVQIRRRVRADQQHAASSVRQGDRRGTRQGGLADAAFAGEEQKAWRGLNERLKGSARLVMRLFRFSTPANTASSFLSG